MIQKFIDSETVLTAPGVIGKKRFAQNAYEILQIRIESKKNIPSHSMNVFASFFIASGKGEVNIDGKNFKIEKGDMIELKPGENREWINTADDMLDIIVVKYLGTK